MAQRENDPSQGYEYVVDEHGYSSLDVFSGKNDEYEAMAREDGDSEDSEMYEVLETVKAAGRKVKAKQHYNAQSKNELGIEVDDVILILNDNHPDWWFGRKGDRSGYLPVNCVEFVDEEDTEADHEAEGKKAKVKFRYKAQNKDELNLNVDDIVFILDDGGDWWYGRIGQKIGLIPSNYVELLEEKEIAPPSGAEYVTTPKIGPEASSHAAVSDEERDTPYEDLLPSYKTTVMRGEWKPKPISEVVTYKVKGLTGYEWSKDTLFTTPDKYLKRMAESTGDIKTQVELKFIQEILPSMELECRKSDHHADETYKILAKLACCHQSPRTVKHSLNLLRQLLTKEVLNQNTARTILNTEGILRVSFSAEGLFKFESGEQRRLRLTVYNQVLCLLGICLSREFLTFEVLKCDEFSALHENLKTRVDTTSKKKGMLNYAAELTLASLKWISSGKRDRKLQKLNEALKSYEELLSILGNQKEDKDGKKRKEKLARQLCDNEWFYLNVILRCLEHKARQNVCAVKALSAILGIVLTRKVAWQIVVATTDILTKVAMRNKNKGIRIEAGVELVSLLEATRDSELKEAIEKTTSRVLFSPDVATRDYCIERLYAASPKPLEAEKTINYLCWFYSSQALERRGILWEKSGKLVFKGLFLGEHVAVKLNLPSSQDLGNGERSDDGKKIMSAMMTEAYFLRRLNQIKKHPNILHLLCCNTVRIPFHVISAFQPKGNLLDFLRHDCRFEAPMRDLASLSVWCVQILEAVVFLFENNIVHKKIRAKSVLLNEKEVCKLSGFSAAEQIEDEHSKANLNPNEVEDHMAISGIVRWMAPEVVRYGLYSKASDTWSFAVLMYEVFSFGCEPFKPMPDGTCQDDFESLKLILSGQTPPEFPCFDKKVFNLMQKCWVPAPSQRIHVYQLRGDLVKLSQEFTEKSTDLPTDPPNLSEEEEDDVERKKKFLHEISSARAYWRSILAAAQPARPHLLSNVNYSSELKDDERKNQLSGACSSRREEPFQATDLPARPSLVSDEMLSSDEENSQESGEEENVLVMRQKDSSQDARAETTPPEEIC